MRGPIAATPRLAASRSAASPDRPHPRPGYGRDAVERALCAVARLVARAPLLDVVALLALPLAWCVRLRALNGRTVVQAIDGLFGPLSLRGRMTIARQIVATELRNRCLGQLIRLAGLASVVRLIRCVDVRSLEAVRVANRGAVIVYWHHGARAAVSAALRQLGMGGVFFSHEPRGFGAASREHPDAPPVEFLVVRESRHRVAHLARAVRHLSAGGLVGIAMDGRQGTATVEVPFLGRGFAVTRGPALLPRLTGAPLIPVVATWASDGAIEVRSFEPLAVPPVAGRDPEQWDRAVLTLAAQFFEALVRRTPGQVRGASLRNYWRAPEWRPPDGVRLGSDPPP
ncbi:MAG TPA: hypothetical protein VFC42_12470 [Methylomirabilota bacterium]|nr:hypothetical protein [Methylomirabilota bacterium]